MAEAVERARDLQGDGVAGRLTLDWPALAAFKRTFTEEAAASVERTFADFADKRTLAKLNPLPQCTLASHASASLIAASRANARPAASAAS